MTKKKNLLFLLLMFPFISPLSWQSSAAISAIYFRYKYFSTALIALYGIYCFCFKDNLRVRIRYKKANLSSNLICFFLFLYYMIYVIDTCIQAPEYLEETFKACVPEVAFIFLARQWLMCDERAFVSCFSKVFNIYVLINFFFALLMPGYFGVRQYDGRYIYFLGERNSLIFFLIPVIIFSILDSMTDKRKKLNTYVVTLVCAITIILSGSSTALGVAIICFLMLLLGSKHFRVTDNILNVDIKGKLLFLIYVIIWIMMILLQNVSMFSFFIENILGRNLTFTNRTQIWNKAFALIQESPIWGHGGYFIQHIRIKGWTLYTCHNFVLQNIVDAGIVSVALLGLILWLTVCKQDELKNSQRITILKIGLFAIFVSCLTESYNMHYAFLLIVFIWTIIDKEKRGLRE